ncbi:helix-turn-helix domain-containing protein [Bacillus pseudomycoides]|uniref:helix-turn-helix domain-containing protein n=1 Tax=Bacillus pseudomycoides TaxID=64104 RepID=UPI0023D9D867|nr:helix-turn-helix transcriptional regulator [Bacillus pseudomycoides]MDF2083822.1 helix-turn-helix transcriptional regulator [Bacillus pseudomycoides]
MSKAYFDLSIILKRRKMTQVDLAEKTGMSNKSLSRVNIKKLASLKTLTRIADALEVTIWDLLKESNK